MAEGPADSDEEFAEELHPTADDTAVNQDVTLQEEEFSTSELSSPDPPLEVRFLEGIISSAVTQGLSSVTSRQDQDDDDDADDGRQTGNCKIFVICLACAIKGPKTWGRPQC